MEYKERKKKILEYVKQNPGESMYSIARGIEQNYQMVFHVINMLEAEDYIVTKKVQDENNSARSRRLVYLK